MLKEPYPVYKKPGLKPLPVSRFCVLYSKVINRLLISNEKLLSNCPELHPIIHTVTVEEDNHHLTNKPHHDRRGPVNLKVLEGFHKFVSELLDQLEYGLARLNDSQLLALFLSLGNYSVSPYWLEGKLEKIDITSYTRITQAILLDVKRELEIYLPKHGGCQ